MPFGVHPETQRWDPEIAARAMTGHVQNIMSKYGAATAADREQGRVWYHMAHDHAVRIGGGDVVKGAGILAALSPGTEWEANLQGAYHIAKTGTPWLAEHDTVKSAGQTSDNNTKALRIHAGEHPLDDKVLGGHKVISFFHNILNPEEVDHVTIDKHAHDIAIGHPYGVKKAPEDVDLGLSALGRYKHFAHAYRIATGELDLGVPSRLQATTWVTHRFGR